MTNSGRKQFYLAALLAVAAIAAVDLAFQARATDEYNYLTLAGKMAALDLKAGDFGKFPGYPFLLSLAFRISRTQEAAILLNLALLIGIAILTAETGRKLGLDPQVTLLATLANPFLIFFTARILTEIAFTFAVMLSAYLMLREKNAWAGAAAGAAFTIRYTGGLLGLAFLALQLGKKPPDYRQVMLFAMGGIIGITPLLLANQYYAGNPITPIINYLGPGVVAVKWTSPENLPDRIPSYALLLPALVGSLIALPLFGRLRKPDKRTATVLVTMLLGLEAYSMFGLFNPPLLRYLTVLAPLATLAILSAVENHGKRIAYLLIALNLAIGLAGTAYFNTHYAKNVNHKLAEDYVKDNCATANSNFAGLAEWARGRNTPLEEKPDCIAYTRYEAQMDVPPGYQLEKQFGKVDVYRLKAAGVITPRASTG